MCVSEWTLRASRNTESRAIERQEVAIARNALSLVPGRTLRLFVMSRVERARLGSIRDVFGVATTAQDIVEAETRVHTALHKAGVHMRGCVACVLRTGAPPRSPTRGFIICTALSQT